MRGASKKSEMRIAYLRKILSRTLYAGLNSLEPSMRARIHECFGLSLKFKILNIYGIIAEFSKI